MPQLSCREALLLVLDQVDYTEGACSVAELVGGALSRQVLAVAREAVTSSKDADIHMSPMLRGWRQMDTSRAENMTNETLMEQIELIPLNSGWGLLAELLKRFEKVTKQKP